MLSAFNTLLPSSLQWGPRGHMKGSIEAAALWAAGAGLTGRSGPWACLCGERLGDPGLLTDAFLFLSLKGCDL